MGETTWEKAREAIEAIATDAGYPCWDAQEDIRLLRSALDAGEKAEALVAQLQAEAAAGSAICQDWALRLEQLAYCYHSEKEAREKAERERDEARATLHVCSREEKAWRDQAASLRAERDGALAREAILRDALEEAAKSLETLSHSGSREQELLGDLIDVRGYAGSRARTARAALAESEPTKGGDCLGLGQRSTSVSPRLAVTPAASAPVAGAAVPKCQDMSPGWFAGRWRDWHRGHGCDLDDGRPRSPEGVAEIEAHRKADIAKLREQVADLQQDVVDLTYHDYDGKP